MLYRKRRVHRGAPGGFFHLEDEATKTRVFGFGHGDNIKLTDEFGNVWRGVAERIPGDAVVYRFRDAKGRSLSGVSEGTTVTLRDDKGNTWKGFVE